MLQRALLSGRHQKKSQGETALCSSYDLFSYLFTYQPLVILVPSKGFRTSSPVLLFMLYTDDIWVCDQKNMTRSIRLSAFTVRHLHSDV